MNSVTPEYVEPIELFNHFVKTNKKFEERFASLLSCMNDFIAKRSLGEQVKVNSLALGYALVDYYEDILRLKEFHKLGHVNTVKIVAYTSYWLLQRKPIQILGSNKSLLYINERFVLYYILDFLSNDKRSILANEKKGVESFSETLFYCLKYRNLSSNSLEMIIMAFLAGRIYQEEKEDLSDILSKFDDSL